MIKFQYDVLDAVNTISSALSTKTLIPPFSATAIIAGQSYLKTFDGKTFDFIGADGCSYLLAADFLYNRFSVIANYQGIQRSSISVISNQHMIEIHDNQEDMIKVTLDNRNVELPIAFDNTFVRREGLTVTVENNEGLRVVCNMAMDLCSVTISGWYFGKTGGLLGIYDNEPSNDWMTPEREVVHTLKEFATSWQMNDQDRHCPVKEPPVAAHSTAWELAACKKVFKDEQSSLKPCFSTVDPQPYLEMCLKDIQKVRNRPEKMAEGICLSSAAYLEECHRSNVEIWMPFQCITCQSSQDQAMYVGEMSTYPKRPSADVVFIIERKSACPSDFYRQTISELPEMINRNMEATGLTDNRFAIVGFGGKNHLTSPHIITSGSRIFSSAERTATSMKS